MGTNDSEELSTAVLPRPDILSTGAGHRIGRLLLGQLPFADRQGLVITYVTILPPANRDYTLRVPQCCSRRPQMR
jgi:hypothetical protein